jgi:acetolactate synthase small subunit
VRTEAAAEESTALLITTVASSAVLARIVVLVGSRGGQVSELTYSVSDDGLARIRGVVMTRPGRGHGLAGPIARLVEVLTVEVEQSEVEGRKRCAAPLRPAGARREPLGPRHDGAGR